MLVTAPSSSTRSGAGPRSVTGERRSLLFPADRHGPRTRAKVGAYCEVKNSRVGAGSKVPHLSYVGDAEIGADANLGAGTITANYDGENKHRTMVGDGAHTGVNTNLIAPVTVGEDAYTGPGPWLTKTCQRANWPWGLRRVRSGSLPSGAGSRLCGTGRRERDGGLARR